MKRYQKILLGVFVSGLLMLGGIQIYFSYFLDDQLEHTVASRFHEATDDKYNLEIGDFDLEIFGRQLNVSEIKISNKQAEAEPNIQATLDGFNVSGIDFLTLLWNRSLNLERIELVNPKISYTSPGSSQEQQNQQIKLNNLSRRLSAITLQILQDVDIPRLLIRDLSLGYYRNNRLKPYFSFQNSHIQLRDISIDSASLEDDRIFPSKDITTTFHDIQYQTTNNLYSLTVDQLDFSSVEGTLNMQAMRLIPKYNREQFADQSSHEINRIDLNIDQIQWNGLDFPKLNRTKALTVQKISINKPEIDIYRDKRPPFPPNRTPQLPQQMVYSVPFPVAVDTVAVSGGDIRYTELQPQADKPGHIDFANLSATLTDLTNMEAKLQNGYTPALHAETNIMNQAKLVVDFAFPMDSTLQIINGHLGRMEMKSLNKTLVPTAFVRIDDGEILGLDFEMQVGAEQAKGSMIFRYRDLKISLLDKESNEETFGNKVASLLANTFKIKSDNTGNDLRSADINFKRDPKKSVFNYWWKSLLSGLKSSIGV